MVVLAVVLLAASLVTAAAPAPAMADEPAGVERLPVIDLDIPGRLPQLYVMKEVARLGYGAGPAEVGLLPARVDAPPEGPRALAMAPAGGVAVLDNANRRVLLLDREGRPTGSVPLPVRALDLAVGANDIVVLDEQKPRLIRLRCNAGGWHASRLEEHLLPAQVDLRWMQIEGDRLLVAPDLHLPLARFGQVTALTTPSRQPALATRKLDRHTGLVWLADGNRRLTRLRLRTAERLGSIVALGRDGEGAAFVVVETLRFPVAVSRVEPPAGPTSSRREVAGGLQVRRRLLKLSPAGRLLAIFDAPASRFAMPERDLALDPASSAVVQLRPDTDAATLLRWSRP